MDVFTLAEVAKVLGMPKSRAKNWTIGRPLRIKPTVRAARGTGSRNLYSLDDVYIMALANQLAGDGFSLKTVGRVVALERFHRRPIVKVHHYLVLTREKGNLVPRFHYGRGAWSEIAEREKGILSKYILDLWALREQVEHGLAKLRRRG